MDCAAYPVTHLTSDEVLAGDDAFEKILRNTGCEHRWDGTAAARIEETRSTASQDLNDSLVKEGLMRHWDELQKSIRPWIQLNVIGSSSTMRLDWLCHSDLCKG